MGWMSVLLLHRRHPRLRVRHRMLLLLLLLLLLRLLQVRFLRRGVQGVLWHAGGDVGIRAATATEHGEGGGIWRTATAAGPRRSRGRRRARRAPSNATTTGEQAAPAATAMAVEGRAGATAGRGGERLVHPGVPRRSRSSRQHRRVLLLQLLCVEELLLRAGRAQQRRHRVNRLLVLVHQRRRWVIQRVALVQLLLRVVLVLRHVSMAMTVWVRRVLPRGSGPGQGRDGHARHRRTGRGGSCGNGGGLGLRHVQRVLQMLHLALQPFPLFPCPGHLRRVLVRAALEHGVHELNGGHIGLLHLRGVAEQRRQGGMLGLVARVQRVQRAQLRLQLGHLCARSGSDGGNRSRMSRRARGRGCLGVAGRRGRLARLLAARGARGRGAVIGRARHSGRPG